MLDGLQWGLAPSQVAQLTLLGNRVFTISLLLVSLPLTSTGAEAVGHFDLRNWRLGKLLSLLQALLVVTTVGLCWRPPLGSILFFISHTHVAASDNICRNYLFLPLPALSTPPCLSCMLKSALWQRDYLSLYIVQQSHCRSSECFWIFLWSGIGKKKKKNTTKQRSVIFYLKICCL